MLAQEHSLRLQASITVLKRCTLTEGHSECGVKNTLFLSSEEKGQLSYSRWREIVLEVDRLDQLLNLHLRGLCDFDSNGRRNHQRILQIVEV